jgi:hypothetical protein
VASNSAWSRHWRGNILRHPQARAAGFSLQACCRLTRISCITMQENAGSIFIIQTSDILNRDSNVARSPSHGRRPWPSGIPRLHGSPLPATKIPSSSSFRYPTVNLWIVCRSRTEFICVPVLAAISSFRARISHLEFSQALLTILSRVAFNLDPGKFGKLNLRERLSAKLMEV